MARLRLGSGFPLPTCPEGFLNDDDRRKVLELLTDKEAAELWGITRSGANWIRRRLGVPHPPKARLRLAHRALPLYQQVADTAVIAQVLGVEEDELREALRAAGVSFAAALAPCGTRSAYNRHLRNKEPVDEACRQANNDRPSKKGRK